MAGVIEGAAATATKGGAGKLLGGLGAGLGAVNAVTGAVSTIQAIGDVKKRREFEQAYAALSYEEKKKLDAATLNATNQTERLNILANSFSNIKAAQVINKGKKETQLIILIIGGGIVLLAAAFMIKKI